MINLNDETLRQAIRVPTDGVLKDSPEEKIEKLNFILDINDEKRI